MTGAEPSEGGGDLAEDLGRLVSAALAEPELRIEELRRVSGGASRETWSFDAVGPSIGRRSLILQRRRPGPTIAGPTMAAEDGLLAAAADAGVPVAPTVVDVAEATSQLGEARITERVAGEVLGPRIVRVERSISHRRHLARQIGGAMARVHSIDPATVVGLEPRDPIAAARDGLDAMGEARPAFELSLRWLRDHRPEPWTDAVVHGDFRIGNLLIDGDEITAVLDWELAHLGDPREDLGWLCVRAWRFGGPFEAGGVADLDDVLSGYAEAGERIVDPEAVRWWSVVGTLTWGLICAVQARRHLDGHVRSVELAAIGRRVCENEYDLLDLIGVPRPEPARWPSPASPEDPPAGTHGRPTALELLDAVRGHLSDEVRPTLSGAAAFGVRVAANALAVVERELRLGPGVESAQRRRLDELGFADEAALAAAVRAGEADGRPELLQAVRAAVVDRLRVANPSWLVPPDR